MPYRTFSISVIFKPIIALLALVGFTMVHGQTVLNRKKITLLPNTMQYQLDSVYSTNISSIFILNKNMDTVKLNYDFDRRSGKLRFTENILDTLFLHYRVLPPVFSKPYFRKSTEIIEREFKKDPFAYDPIKDGIFSETNTGLKTDGNISRGISAGNNQDLVVNSNLNLRLGGKIADDVMITGVISDDNNPIQPEGNTQQLQDFDKVFIMLQKDSNHMIVGDFEMHSPGGHFMNYYKKSRGVHLDYQLNQKETKVYTNVDAAISRGRFARNTILGIEGNQGPYRLNGNNGELFIIIISGTEVVYLDGRRLSRGESRDYVIDYNTGEVTFMPNQMITQFSRIVVEFQYSDRNYQRTVFKGGLGIQKKKGVLEINYFNEQDNKNQNFQQSLDGFDSTRGLSAKQILANAGDDIGSAFIPRVKKVVPFDYTKLLYRKLDTLGYKGVYVFAQGPNLDSVFYEVVYSFVGQGKGNYRQKNSTANGRVYEWLVPINGVSQGDYEPVEILIAPNRYQMLTIGGKQTFGNTEAFFEAVYTNNNINTFSNLDKNNDDGYGIAGGLKNVTKLNEKKKLLTLTNTFNTEIVNADFKFLERYRPVEFERNWNKQYSIPTNLTVKLPEVIANYDIALERKNLFKIQYKAGLYRRSKEINGLSNAILADINIKKTRIQTSAERMTNSVTTTDGNRDNSFSTAHAEISRKIKLGNVGGSFHIEESTFKLLNDSLNTGSYAYNSGKLYFESSDTNKLTYGLQAERRQDRLPYLGGFVTSTLADELNWKTGYTAQQGSRISLNGSYRHFQYLDTLVVKGISEKNALGRIEAFVPLFKRAVKFNTYYQIGTGQEQKREFTYLRVADGNGVYIWKDYNEDNVQSLNEFEIASEYDIKRANFIRTSLPVQGFIKSRNVQFNQTLNIAAPQDWYKKKGVKKFLRRFSLLGVFRTDRKTTSDDAELYLNPLIFNLTDLDLLSSNSSLRGTFYINRNNPKWSADVTRIEVQSKLLLVNGFETRKNIENILNTRLNFTRNVGAVAQLISGERSYFSEILTTRNYLYNYYSAEPQLQFTSNNSNLGASLIGKYYTADAGDQKSENLEAGIELRLSKAAKGSFNGSFRLVNIKFDGDPASPLGYELMKGLLPGKNYTWNLVYQQRISSNIQMDISYDGRKSQQSPILHIGRVMARYLF